MTLIFVTAGQLVVRPGRLRPSHKPSAGTTRAASTRRTTEYPEPASSSRGSGAATIHNPTAITIGVSIHSPETTVQRILITSSSDEVSSSSENTSTPMTASRPNRTNRKPRNTYLTPHAVHPTPRATVFSQRGSAARSRLPLSDVSLASPHSGHAPLAARPQRM